MEQNFVLNGKYINYKYMYFNKSSRIHPHFNKFYKKEISDMDKW